MAFVLKDRYEVARVAGTLQDWKLAETKVDPRTARVISNVLGMTGKRENDIDNRIEITFSNRPAGSPSIDDVLRSLLDAVKS